MQTQLIEENPVSNQQKETLSGVINRDKSHFTKKPKKCKNLE
jgi:hypothetical protein